MTVKGINVVNVRVTFSDIKMPKVPFNGTFEVDLLSKSEYFPYGTRVAMRRNQEPLRAKYLIKQIKKLVLNIV